jgi:hypothetical protein
MRGTILITCFSLAVAVPAATAAQTAKDASKDTAGKVVTKDTLPFHKRQFGAEFTAGTSFVSAGMLYFRSQRSAWLLDADFSFNSGKTSVNASDSLFSFSNTLTNGSIGARAGIRTYYPMGPVSQFFTTFGGVVRWSGGTSRGDLEGNDYLIGAGVFGEIGANYMLNNHLGLGATAGANLIYNHQEEHIGNGTALTSNFVSMSGALLALRLGIYF